MKRITKDSFSKGIKDYISVFALIISILSASYQFTQSQRYSDNTNQILMNSAKLAEYDIDLMLYKVNSGGDDTLDYGQFRFQIDSLQQNFKTIESIDPTSLPKEQAINYQVYRQNLNAVIYKVTSYVNGLRVDQVSTPNDSDKLHVDLGVRQNFERGVGSALSVIKEDLKALENKESLYEQDYSNNVKFLEEQK